MTRTALVALFPLVLSGTAAFAEATDDGAAELLGVLQTYLGTTEGVVAVELAGDAYKVTVDVTPLASLAADVGATFSVSPMVMTVTDNGDGTWGVIQDQPMSIAFGADGQMEMQEDIGSIKYEGVFDETLMAFTSAKGEMSNIKIKQTVQDPTMGETRMESSIASGTFELTGAAGASGGVDSTYSMTMTGYSQSMTTPGGEGMPAMPVTISMESLSQSGKIDGLRSEAVLKTVAWFVAHPTTEAKEADKASVKAILTEGLPLFGLLTGDMTAKGMKVGTPMGEVGVDELAVAIEMSGAVPQGKFREAITLSGLTLPAGLVPEWAAPILPQKASIDVQVTDFDAAAGANVLLGLLDLPAGAEPDAAFEDALVAALLPNKTVTISLNPGGVSGQGYELTYEGSMVVGPEMPVPTGKAVVTLKGIEALQAALAAAPSEVQGQSMMVMGMAQGMAKPGADGELVWEIDASTPGTLSVNGMDMMGQ